MAESFTGLGYVYESRGKYKEALEMHRKSLDIQTRILGGDSHPSMAESHVSIGMFWKPWGSMKKRLFNFRRV